jgi:3-oxoacyl-[acyl-carrier-protein] synthase II
MAERRRVVVTGAAGLSPLGLDWVGTRRALFEGRSGIDVIPEWAPIEGLGTRIGGAIRDFAPPPAWPRKKTRTMGRVALLATRASELALEAAGLLGAAQLSDGRTGVAFGSASGSKPAANRYSSALHERKRLQGIAASDYHQLAGHTCSANLAQFFELRGRLVSTSTACVAGSQALGFAAEAIRHGLQDVMIAGGAEELSVNDVAVFDIMRASSRRNAEPARASRPFDADRDGVVVSEGAAALVLESLEHAAGRGAAILGELVGFATNCDGAHMTSPDPLGMQAVMELALADAGLRAGDIGYLCAHGTSTEQGDIAETQATARVFGRSVATSSLKGHLGHALGACGALEAWIVMQALREGWLPGTLNLDRVDPRCAELDYVAGAPRRAEVEFAMSNNFAFGGVNTSLILRRWSERS